MTDRRPAATPESQEWAQLLVQGLREEYLFFTAGPSGEILYVSPSIETILGLPPEQVVGRNWRDFIDPANADIALLEDLERRRFAGEPTPPVDYVALTAQGETRILEVRDFPVLDAAGKVALNQGIAKDVTEQRQTKQRLEQLTATLEQRVASRTDELMRANNALHAEIQERQRTEQRLRESERRLAETQRMAHLGHWSFDLQSDEGVWSEEAANIVGFCPASAGEQAILEITHPDDRGRVRRALEQAEIGQAPVSLEHRIVRPDGQVRWLVTRAQGETNEQGRVARVIGAFQDVTARVEAAEKLRLREEQLAHASRLSTMGELVAGIAHEVNQPLYAIQNYAYASEKVLASETPDLELLREWSRQIAQLASQSGQIMRRMRNFIGRPASERKPSDINRVIREAVEMLAFEARRRRIEIEYDLAPEPLEVIADDAQIAQAVVHLVKNACEEFEEGDEAGRRIVVRTRSEGRQMHATVSDTGPGVAPDVADRIFEVFHTTKPEGLGMGLGISRSIIENHGGRIWLGESELGGATLHFTLPLGEQAA